MFINIFNWSFNIIFKTLFFRYSDVRTMISVSLSKKIALNTWLVAAIPQVCALVSTVCSVCFSQHCVYCEKCVL